MTPRLCLASACSILAALGAVSPAPAQECVGLPGGQGLLTVGFEATDGATGQGIGFAFQTRRAAVLLQHRSLADVSLSDERNTSAIQGSVEIPDIRLPVCVAVGAEWTAYDNSFYESTTRTPAEPGYRIERYRIGGPYERLRLPVGISVGREYRIGRRLALVPFLQPAVVFDRESYRPAGGARETRSGWGWGASGGVTVAFDWLVLRAGATHVSTRDRTLSSQANDPVVSLHAGVRF